MDDKWEWKWAYWDEKLRRFESTSIWMTDAEACGDFRCYSAQQLHKIEHTKRDRNRVPQTADDTSRPDCELVQLPLAIASRDEGRWATSRPGVAESLADLSGREPSRG